ncbi:phasin family protein [Chthonobacter rhizosphaerae]|uniref:phasin family protein n=1 Tax=Chthonobacter rhizosphaerae TaxID=2735553 RepID=UPI0015EF157B|nr:phasin family protein [Chthonobacter rhizosphaerae]
MASNERTGMGGGPDGLDPTGSFRAAAEQTVDQARKAFDDALGLAQKAIGGMETNAASLQSNLQEMTRETLDFAGASAEAAFTLVEQLSKAKDPAEIAAIQKAFLEAQMQRLGRQARVFGDNAIRTAQDLTKPFER